jgi:uncharacterized membrane protein YheB (UPF0754 family)
MNSEWIRILATVVAGSLAGGLTNSVAVWMLFHPHAPPRIGPWTLRFLHGAIPKNQARLASAIGRTVGNRLLSDGDLRDLLQSRGFRAAFDRRIDEALAGPLAQSWGSLADHLTQGTLTEVEAILGGVADHLEARMLAWIQDPSFESAVQARIDALTSPAAQAWLTQLLESEAFSDAVDRALKGATTRLLQPERALGDLLPPSWSEPLERVLAGYLPVAVRQLGRSLEDPAARARVEAVLQELLQKMLRDLKLHQRLVARLVITEDAVERMVQTIQTEGAEAVANMLREPELQASLARSIQGGIRELLRKPATDVLGHAEDPAVVEVRRSFARWLISLGQTLVHRNDEASHGNLLASIPRDRIGLALVQMARSEAGAALVRQTLRPWILGLVHQPLGTPARWLGPDGENRLALALRDPLWDWVQGQVPEFLARLDIQQRVENKVLAYPTRELEALVRRVTDRELRLIIRLGYLLGGIIGMLLVLIHHLVPGARG